MLCLYRKTRDIRSDFSNTCCFGRNMLNWEFHWVSCWWRCRGCRKWLRLAFLSLSWPTGSSVLGTQFQSSSVAVVPTVSVSTASDFNWTVSGKGMLPLCGVGWRDLKCHHRSAHTRTHREEAVIKKEGIQRTKYSTSFCVNINKVQTSDVPSGWAAGWKNRFSWFLTSKSKKVFLAPKIAKKSIFLFLFLYV